MTKRTMHPGMHVWVLQSVNPGSDQQTEREEMVPIETFAIRLVALAEGRSGQRLRGDTLIANHVHRSHEVADRSPVTCLELVQPEPAMLPRQKSCMTMLVQDVVVSVVGHVILED